VGEVRLSKLAQQDLIEIWQRIASDNGAIVADRWIDRIESRCRQLSSFPSAGPFRPDIAPDARMLLIGHWLALYRIEMGGVRILRVIHAARDLGEIDLSAG
jgi:toxin ParE1/3/4